MKEDGELLDSLGKAKSKSFGETLKEAINFEFGTSKAFAHALGVSPGRVSQVMQGPESVDPQTLKNILRTFNDHLLRASIHTAWVREFAPRPEVQVGNLNSDEVLLRISGAGRTISVKTALKLAQSQRNFETNEVLWEKLSERIVHLHQQLLQTSFAYETVSEMQERASLSKDALGVLKSLWMKTNVLISSGTVPFEVIEKAQSTAHYFASSIALNGSPEDQVLLARKEQMNRDAAILIYHGVESGELDSSAIDQAREIIRKSKATAEGAPAYLYALEVQSRFEIACGNVFKAEEMIDELEKNLSILGGDYPERIELSKAKLLILRGRRDEAVNVLRQFLQACLSRGNLHQAKKADQALTKAHLLHQK